MNDYTNNIIMSKGANKFFVGNNQRIYIPTNLPFS